MGVHVARDAECPEIDDASLQRAARVALEHGRCPEMELSVVLVDDPTLVELHERCLGDPSPTDVMSFDLSDEAAGPAGEVLVSVDRARDVAAQRDVAVARELTLYVVHGTLHLCGFDDHDPADRDAMRVAERAVMDRLGHVPDDAPHDM